MEISSTDRVEKEEALHRVRKESSVLQKIKPRKDNRIGHTYHRLCILKHLIEGKFKVLEEGEDVSSYRIHLRQREKNWNLKDEAVDCTFWRIRFGRGYGHAVRQTKQ